MDFLFLVFGFRLGIYFNFNVVFGGNVIFIVIVCFVYNFREYFMGIGV